MYAQHVSQARPRAHAGAHTPKPTPKAIARVGRLWAGVKTREAASIWEPR